MIACLLPCYNWAEEASILDGAIGISLEQGLVPASSLIDGNFKSFTDTDGSSTNGGSKEFIVNLKKEVKIVSAFV